MKKLFLGAAIAMSSLAFAQQFGVKGGLNVSSISNTEDLLAPVLDADSKSKIGFNAGVFMNMPLTADFGIQPEILYNNLGAKMTADDGKGNSGSLKLNLDYISVPVMFQYNATPEFYLEAGPQFSLLVSSKLKTEANGKTETSSDVDKDDFNSFDFGLGIGAGYYITPQLGVTARYVAGFTEISKENPTDNKLKNNVFQVGLAYKFGSKASKL